MISKEKFIGYINKIKDLRELEHSINEIGFGYNLFELNTSVIETLLVDILTEAMSDKENGWIEYFLYELDGGVTYYDGVVKDNGINVSLRSPEDLYELLIKNKNKT